MKKEKILSTGIGISIFLNLLFFVSQSFDAPFLKLPVHWLVLALLPVILSLFIGGYINKFKGFGVELESAIKAPVTTLDLDLKASDAVANIPGDEKKSIMYLDNMSKEKAKTIRWLLFTTGKRDYYGAWTVKQYLERLPNLEFFEVRSKMGDIICFVPVEAFQIDSQNENEKFDIERIEDFVAAINENKVPSEFSDVTITLKVQSNASLVDVLKKMRSENTKLAAVISETGRYIGVVFAHDVESRIADSVLNTSKG